LETRSPYAAEQDQQQVRDEFGLRGDDDRVIAAGQNLPDDRLIDQRQRADAELVVVNPPLWKRERPRELRYADPGEGGGP
jgi:hypothetical protein